LGNGWTPVDYTEQKLEGDEESIKQIKSLLKEGDEHLLKREFAEADAAFGKVLEFMPTNFKAMIGKGTLNYHQKEYDSALNWFFEVLDIHPDYGLAHYGVSRSLLRKKDKINVKFAEIEKAFAAKDVPEPPYLRDVFINYDQLDPDLQKILRLSVQPLKNYLQTLKTAVSTFYLIPFHKRLWESPHHSGMKGTRTFDLRLWDDVKGCGGIHSTSGEDWEKDVKYLRFNVVTHEFAHQVHSYLTEKQRKEIKRLFIKAKKERRTLDFYADFNEWEYFAVGVEAYVSEEKLADQKLAYGHTRKELLERDPDLYNFIEGLGKQKSTEEKYDEGIYAELNTNKGLIVLLLEFKKVPMTTVNFVGLAEGTIKNSALPDGVPYYNRTRFHRVVRNHVIQAGAPSGTDKTSPGYVYPNEIYPGLSHNRAGVLGMANGGPHTNGSQFYITLSDRSYLDGDYTVFGHVIQGMDVVNNIVQGDVIESVKIVRIGREADEFKPDTDSFQRLVRMAEQRVKKEEERKKRTEAKIIQRNWAGAIEAENGSKFIIVKKGKSDKPETGTKLKVVYTGQFLDGRMFSSSAEEGKPVPTGEAEPFIFEAGKSRVNPGLDAVLMDMRKGEKRIAILPAHLAYGTGGFYAREKKGEKRFVISPNTTLVYEVELLDIIK
jgi:peptidylprolyl isomerase